MQFNKNRTLAIAISVLLIISMTASLALVPSASAHVPAWQIPTFAYINAAPSPVGVGQNVVVIMWLTNLFSPASGIGNDYRFHNYKLTITAPDGTVTTQSYGIVADSTSAQDYSFAPSQVGTYNLTFTFPGQDFNTYDHDTTIPAFFGPASPETLINDTYLPSSASTTLVVQQQAIPFTATYPLPTEYWTRPIYGENPGWWTISSNWLGSGSPVEASAGSWAIGAYGANSGFSGAAMNRNPGDAIGSQTSHVMWTKPLQAGGIVGGNNFAIIGDSYFEGSAYVQRYDNPIIMDGILYYQAPLGYSSGQGGGTYAVDLQTGKVLWQNNAIPTGALSFGYIYDSQQPNQKGVMQPILFTSSFAQAYDAYTGQYLFNVSNVPSGVPISMGPNGETVMYTVSNGYLAEWNSSGLWNWNIQVGGGVPAAATTNFQVTSVGFTGPTTTSYTNTVNGGAPQCYDWNVSLPTTLPSSFQQVAAFYGNMILCESGTLSGVSIGLLTGGVSSSWAPYTYFALNVNASRGALGSVMWTNTVPAAPGNVTVLLGPVDPTSGVFTEGYKETMQWVGYSLSTGAKLWGPTPSQAPLDYYGNPITPLIQAQLAYGNLYSMGYSGILYCYDAKTGTLKWTYGNGGAGNSTNAGLNSPFGDYPSFINAVGNGVIYTVASEHTVNTPIYKGALQRAINATDGTEIWTISGYTGEFSAMSYAIADGYNTWFNGYDNQIYVVGRGPSSLTVTAPNNAADSGSPVVIRGTVTDVSAGTTQTQQAGQFPNGVPVASDASMKDWMGYVYQQKPLPNNFTGVQVTVDVVDSNGNYRNIGTTSTDATGMYSLAWTPNIAGNYTVVATFHGTNGYYPSYSETSFAVAEAHATTAPASATPAPSAADLYFVPAIAGLFVLIIIVAIVLAILMLRKRP
jgi:outer membrane protein assembly factor BamB